MVQFEENKAITRMQRVSATAASYAQPVAAQIFHNLNQNPKASAGIVGLGCGAAGVGIGMGLAGRNGDQGDHFHGGDHGGEHGSSCGDVGCGGCVEGMDGDHAVRMVRDGDRVEDVVQGAITENSVIVGEVQSVNGESGGGGSVRL